MPHIVVVDFVQYFIPRQIFYFLIDRLVKLSIFGPQFKKTILKARGW